MNWQPNKEQGKYLNTIASMTVDCLMGKGTVDRGTYTSNLKMMADLIDKIKEASHEGGRR